MIGRFSQTPFEHANHVLTGLKRPTFGFAKDLGSVSSTAASVLFTIGVSQDDIINFAVSFDETHLI